MAKTRVVRERERERRAAVIKIGAETRATGDGHQDQILKNAFEQVGMQHLAVPLTTRFA